MSVSKLLRGAAIDDEINESSLEIKTVMSRLSSIIEIILSCHRDIIAEIQVDPLNILQAKLRDLKEMTIYITLLDRSAMSSEDVKSLKDFVSALVLDEFEEVSVKVEDITKCGVRKCPTLLLYTVFPSKPVEELYVGADYWTLYFIINNMGYNVSVPYTADLQLTRSVIIHTGDTSAIAGLEDALNGINIGVKFTEYMGRVKKSEIAEDSVYYIPMVSKERLGYNLPYLFLTVDTFNKQFVESALNCGLSGQHIQV